MAQYTTSGKKLKTTEIKYNLISNLNLKAGDTYQLNLPANTIFIEPLVASSGSEYSGGQFLALGKDFTYLTNNDTNSTYKGIWIKCDKSGLVTISDYKHCGVIVKGFRIWYYEF